VTVDPDAPVGTLNVQLNAPVAFASREPLVHVAIVTPPRTRPTGLDTEKPVPETVTGAPTGPWLGVLTVIVSTVTANSWVDD
jgi:hypothetical protein